MQLVFSNFPCLFIYSKHAFRDELEGFRRDVEILRSRVGKCPEMDKYDVFTKISYEFQLFCDFFFSISNIDDELEERL